MQGFGLFRACLDLGSRQNSGLNTILTVEKLLSIFGGVKVGLSPDKAACCLPRAREARGCSMKGACLVHFMVRAAFWRIRALQFTVLRGGDEAAG